MSSYEGRFVKIGVVFDALYFENEVGDPQFFSISDIGNSLYDCSQSMKKICIVELFRANVLKCSIDFWHFIGAPKFILDIIKDGYKISFITDSASSPL